MTEKEDITKAATVKGQDASRIIASVMKQRLDARKIAVASGAKTLKCRLWVENQMVEMPLLLVH